MKRSDLPAALKKATLEAIRARRIEYLRSWYVSKEGVVTLLEDMGRLLDEVDRLQYCVRHGEFYQWARAMEERLTGYEQQLTDEDKFVAMYREREALRAEIKRLQDTYESNEMRELSPGIFTPIKAIKSLWLLTMKGSRGEKR